MKVNDLAISLARRSVAVRTMVYLREIGRLITKPHSKPIDLKHLVSTFFDWQHSLTPGAGPLQDQRPWITYGAIKYLETILRPDMRVFEWGSGGSTVFFAQRVREGVSIEHDSAWALQVTDRLRTLDLHCWLVRVIPPDPTPPADAVSELQGYASDDPTYAGQSFRSYAEAIDEYPDEHFDLIVLDGRARPSCFHHALSKVKPGGYLLLDNSDRPYYHRIHDSLRSGWDMNIFSVPSPYTFGFSQSTIWRRQASHLTSK